jgi:hypothetical protein
MPRVFAQAVVQAEQSAPPAAFGASTVALATLGILIALLVVVLLVLAVVVVVSHKIDRLGGSGIE